MGIYKKKQEEIMKSKNKRPRCQKRGVKRATCRREQKNPKTGNQRNRIKSTIRETGIEQGGGDSLETIMPIQ